MKTLNYKQGLFLFIPLFLASMTIQAEEITKKFHKEYSASDNTTLNISNKYGDVVIQSWDKDQIVIDVKVTVDMPNREKAEKLIAYIDVQFSQEENMVSAKTVIDDKFNFTGWGDSKKFSIDYDIRMPAAAALQLANKYGDTDFDVLTGLVNLDIKYGNLNAGKMTRGNVKPLNKLTLAYGKANIDEAGWLDLNARYSGGVEITRSQALLVDSRYSKLELGETSSMVGDSKYDNIKIEKINNLVLENGYTETKIGELTKKLSYNGSYGSFSVDRVPSGFESIETDTRYMGVRLGIDESAGYRLNAKVTYGGLNYNEDNFRNERRIIENNSKEVSGIVGSDDAPKSKINVTASYGSVKLE